MNKDPDFKLMLVNIKQYSTKIRTQNTTKKTKGEHYPIPVGYAKAVTRPVKDILRWMAAVEDLLENLIEVKQ